MGDKNSSRRSQKGGKNNNKQRHTKAKASVRTKSSVSKMNSVGKSDQELAANALLDFSRRTRGSCKQIELHSPTRQIRKSPDESLISPLSYEEGSVSSHTRSNNKKRNSEGKSTSNLFEDYDATDPDILQFQFRLGCGSFLIDDYDEIVDVVSSYRSKAKSNFTRYYPELVTFLFREEVCRDNDDTPCVPKSLFLELLKKRSILQLLQ